MDLRTQIIGNVFRLFVWAGCSSLAATAASATSLVGALATTSPAEVVSTVPSNGDLNPYGVAFVPEDYRAGGPLRAGDLLVSNFNGAGNAQGTGTTIVRVTPEGGVSVFFSGRQGLGLSTALAVLKSGYVIVGNVPSTDGLGICTPGPHGEEQGVGQGSLLILDRHGALLRELSNEAFLDGPWDLAVRDDGDRAAVFVSNVLNGTVSRIDLALEADRVHVIAMTRIGSGFAHRCDPAAFVVGPTGLALDTDHDLLYVAATADNAIHAIRAPLGRHTDAHRGDPVVANAGRLHGPVGLLVTPQGNLVTTQGDAVHADPRHPSELIEYTPAGRFVAEFSIDPSAGSAFGLALQEHDGQLRFAAVDDGLNVLEVWSFGEESGVTGHRAAEKAATVQSGTTLTVSTGTSGYTTTYTLTATVTGSTPTGNVSFFDGMTMLKTVPLSGGKASFTTSSLGTGSHSLSAAYAGDATNMPSTSAVDTVNVGSSGGGGGGGGGGYGGGAFGFGELALLLLAAGARRLRPRVS